MEIYLTAETCGFCQERKDNDSDSDSTNLNANMKSLKNNKQTSVFSVKCKLQLKRRTTLGKRTHMRKLNQGHIMVFSPEVSKIPKELDPIL